MLNETQMAQVARDSGATVEQVALALDMSPMGPRENLIHGLAAIEEYRAAPRGPKAVAHVLYAHRRLHEADRLLADYRGGRALAAMRGGLVKQCGLRIIAAMRALMTCESQAARDAESAHVPSNDNG